MSRLGQQDDVAVVVRPALKAGQKPVVVVGRDLQPVGHRVVGRPGPGRDTDMDAVLDLRIGMAQQR
jgi:hypothetical protein